MLRFKLKNGMTITQKVFGFGFEPDWKKVIVIIMYAALLITLYFWIS